MPVAMNFPDPGMIDHLRELAAAEPFKPFTIRLQTGTKLRVVAAKDIQFTIFGAPKVYAKTTGKHGLEERSGWHILNIDAIAEILL
jgi:hypothetical protein